MPERTEHGLGSEELKDREISQTRLKEIRERAEADAMEYLEIKFRENIRKKKLPKVSKEVGVSLDFDVARPISATALEELKISTGRERLEYLTAFAIAAGLGKKE